MDDNELVQAVILFLNEGFNDGCRCAECVQSETDVAVGVIKLVRDHDKEHAHD